MAAHRAAEARRIVAQQRALIVGLTAAGLSTADAKIALLTYIALQENLEGHERRLRAEARAKKDGQQLSFDRDSKQDGGTGL